MQIRASLTERISRPILTGSSWGCTGQGSRRGPLIGTRLMCFQLQSWGVREVVVGQGLLPLLSLQDRTLALAAVLQATLRRAGVVQYLVSMKHRPEY
ncbi:hypothetical protein PBY51_018337 [Eleginops maclovinus]|uniref:Uncharacterized protein n=1 Tax=Eleginops maclovinus TaxID=56733 RepID=A0AAN7Y730_ELEMC|nr:hypothetical protein PBY51_018337 [Eleginops maclovinus]